MINYSIKENQNGPTIGYVKAGVIEKDGLFFKDSEGTGELLPYEDWRLSPEERAKDLASRLSVEEIAGLMMYSAHQIVPAEAGGWFGATYNGGKAFEESGAAPSDLTDQQRKFLTEDHVRYVLAMMLKNGEIAANWNNEMQALCEEMPHAIPVNISTDPRHGAGSASAEFKTEAKDTSKWPLGLGLAATFSPELVKRFARVAANEYRALGITTELGPQIDLGTEPRWMRVPDTWGPCSKLATDYAKAYCEGLQTDPDAVSGDGKTKGGWGNKSVAAMVKHWPGGGPCESGRDAHYGFGKFAVYPGNNFEEHLRPFLEGAFKLDGGTKEASSVMPYYTVSYGVDPSGKNVGNSYSKYIIGDLLRDKYGYKGIVCTDWGITADPDLELDSFGSRCYGTEDLSEAERHLQIIENGVDQFGGNNNIAPILEAYRIGCERHGEEAMRKRFEESAQRLLVNSFRCGLFENPYLDANKSKEILGCDEYVEEGFKAQLQSIAMVKNNGALPIESGAASGSALAGAAKKKVYIPDRHIDEHKGFMRFMEKALDIPGAKPEDVEPFYEVTKDTAEADFAICFIESPISDGYTKETGYRPVTLQYREYTATASRAESIGQGDFREKENPNRSYLGKSNKAANESDLNAVIETKKKMGDKPVIVVIRMNNPCMVSEFEEYADAILVNFGVETKAALTVISGGYEPTAMLPVQIPKNMETVEKHCEDKPFDYEPYKDSLGNVYDFGFGLNWSGVIKDERYNKYVKG
ncbi:glycoside hydrolase family 3 N-terminal domain-containing protein [Butyrivibrio sp. INlla16]|uniref:glycoside hydrolase family 3 protein n=1 Tax=Butyrivibrio sp. INlla16 TaxID=1520807 RepID=UPI00087E4FC3|nr:glycoside hydrolase family 3 N-terminal domain-containing protein [Butyrivibrio sp. INlla16]SDB06167.1 beta-glucosidase [Butyrivibrio sp. INlla16]